MSKKIVTVLLVVALTISISIGGTLAYLTDRDSKTNVFTTGDVTIDLEESFDQGAELVPGVEVDKDVKITNTGKNDAYVWYTYAVPAALKDYLTLSFNEETDKWVKAEWEGTYTDENNVAYVVYAYQWNEVLAVDAATDVGLTAVTLSSTIDIDPDGNWNSVANRGTVTDLGWSNADGNPVIYVSAYAVQSEGFENVDEAFAAYNTQWTTAEGVNKGLEYAPAATLVATPEQLTAALAEGKSVALTADIEIDADETITVASGKTVNLNLNGHKLFGTADGTGNREMFLVKGTMTVSNGELKMTATQNQGWNAMATIFDVTAGGALNLDHVTANVSGTDMTFVVHLNNWGEVTLNVNKCDLTANYCPIRVFNSGYDMNNVIVRHSTIHGDNRAFWVHNYIGDLDETKHPDADVKARLNIDLINGTNTITNGTAENPKNNPIRYGFGEKAVYYDANGNDVTVRN